MDLKSSYWQVEIEENHKHKTAFRVGNLGFFECNRMPFGLTNAPATFQRLIETCMGDLHLNSCLLYLDDIVVFSRSFEEHLTRLEAVFQRLHQAGLKLKTSKFIRNFSQIARPLYEVTTGVPSKRNKIKICPGFRWGPKQEDAFKKLKDLVTSAPVLAFANFNKPFILHTDASAESLGACLYQEQDDNTERPIAFASRGLSQSERNYPAHKLEFLSLKWAVTDKFHDYLYGVPFHVITDNNPLTYIFTTAKLDATSQRWVYALSNYQFSIEYRSGKLNQDADGLSRIRWPEALNIQHVSCNSVQALLSVSTLPAGCSEALVMSHKAIQDIEGLILENTPVEIGHIYIIVILLLVKLYNIYEEPKFKTFNTMKLFKVFFVRKTNLLLSKVSFTEEDYVITSSNSSWFFQRNIGKLLYKVAMIRLDILDVIEH